VSAAATNAATTRWILWAALLAAVAIHAALPLLLPLEPTPAHLGPLRVLFPGLALAAAAGGVALHRVGLVRPIARGALDPASPDAAPRVTAVFVVAWALAEVPAILGLVLAVLTGQPTAGWGLALLSVASLVLLAPRVASPPPSAASLATSDRKIG
jgi:hypothetical protein